MATIKMSISKVKLPFYLPCEVKWSLQNGLSTECPSLTKLEKRISMYEKRHQTLQSVFNRGEYMMNADQNVDRHVVDQNVDRISGEIAYIPLGGRIKSKCSSCMQFFFFFWMSTRHAYLRSRKYGDPTPKKHLEAFKWSLCFLRTVKTSSRSVTCSNTFLLFTAISSM